jgi:coenzyme F420-reducing hydrogenase beta subunit
VCPVLDSYLGNEVSDVVAMHGTKSDMTGQDGATVTALLSRLFDLGIIDCVIGVRRDEHWNPAPILIENKKDIPSIAFSKYTYVPTLVPILRDAMDYGFTRIGLSGVPCQCHSWDLCRDEFERYRSKISVIIGVFCMETFDRQRFLSEYLSSKGVSPERMKKVDITHGRLILYSEEEKKSEKIKSLGHLVRDGCHSCVDFSSFFADISVGSVGSPDGWNTLVVRTERGREIWEKVSEIFTIGTASPEEVESLSAYKRKMRFEEYKVVLPDMKEIYEKIVEAQK